MVREEIQYEVMDFIHLAQDSNPMTENCEPDNKAFQEVTFLANSFLRCRYIPHQLIT